MSLYERVMARPGGARAVAQARLRSTVRRCLSDALGATTRADLARSLGVRRSAVGHVINGGGNVRVDTLAAYLWELGYELDVRLVPAGTHRAEAIREQP